MLIVIFVISALSSVICTYGALKKPKKEEDHYCRPFPLPLTSRECDWLLGFTFSMLIAVLSGAFGFIVGWTSEGRKETYMEERQELINKIEKANDSYTLNVLADKVYDYNEEHGDDKDLYIDFNSYVKDKP